MQKGEQVAKQWIAYDAIFIKYTCPHLQMKVLLTWLSLGDRIGVIFFFLSEFYSYSIRTCHLCNFSKGTKKSLLQRTFCLTILAYQ